MNKKTVSRISVRYDARRSDEIQAVPKHTTKKECYATQQWQWSIPGCMFMWIKSDASASKCTKKAPDPLNPEWRIQKRSFHRMRARRPTMRAPVMTAAKLGSTCANPRAPLICRPWLVPARASANPLSPFEVARTEGSMVMVGPWRFVYAVVGKVIVELWSDSASALLVRNTRAKPGAGTLTW